jgi:XTP/dITP diphosphohydrolase
MSRRSSAARIGAQTTTGRVVVVADSSTIGSSSALPDADLTPPASARSTGHDLVLLVTSPRVAPGQLTSQAWDALRGAGRVLTGQRAHPQLTALAEAGVVAEFAAVGDVGATARLLASAEPGPVVWLADPGADDDVAALLAALGALPGGGPAAEVLVGSVDLPGSRLLDLVVTMDTLRVNCPWDARQTHETLAPHLLEESYEALEALESGDSGALRDELGDVLLQVVFHARVAAERTDGTGYTVDDVADGIVRKLVRRHPHVFGGVEVSGAEEVKRNWDAIKAEERATPDGRLGAILDGVPFGQPALALAAQLQRRAERAGVPAGLTEEPAGPTGPAGLTGETGTAESVLGAELFRLVASARAAGLDPELELRAAARRYRDRVRDWEKARESGGAALG